MHFLVASTGRVCLEGSYAKVSLSTIQDCSDGIADGNSLELE